MFHVRAFLKNQNRYLYYNTQSDLVLISSLYVVAVTFVRCVKTDLPYMLKRFAAVDHYIYVYYNCNNDCLALNFHLAG